MRTNKYQPFIVECNEDGNFECVTPAKRLNFGSDYDEAWLQRLLFKVPSLIAVESLDERIQKCLFPLAMEVGLPSGICDNLFISQDGYVVIVETKLWRNPQSRREVVAQILDYATHVRRWNYSEIESVWRKDQPNQSASLWEQVAPAEDEAEWIDLVNRNLQAGRMALVVAGDGIREEAWDLGETVNGHPDFEFRLGLVEIRLYQTISNTIIAIPYVQTRTKEITRAIVRIEGEERLSEGLDIRIETPAGELKSRKQLGRRIPKPDDLTMAEFWDYVVEVAGERSHDVRSCVEQLLNDLTDEEFSMQMKGRSPVFVTTVGECMAQVGRLYSNGHFVCYVTKGAARHIAPDIVMSEKILDECDKLRKELGINQSSGVDIGLPLSKETYSAILHWLKRSNEILKVYSGGVHE